MTTNELETWVKRRACPHCQTKRLLMGPFYDRLKLRCSECGAQFRIRLKERH